MRTTLLPPVALLCCVLVSSDVTGGDWPQILGPSRNGVAADDERLITAWPEGGPKRRWEVKVGSGFAGPAVVGNELYVFHRVGDRERLQRFEADTGREVWRADFSASYRGGINPDNGPRCVPLVHGPHVYLFGAAGDLHCVARSNGTQKWSRSTHEDFQADEGYFGAGSTPILLGKLILVNVGGTPDAGIVAFDVETGATAWKVPGERASYSAPTSAVIDGKTYAIFATRYNAVAVEPTSGQVRFRFPFGKRGPTVNAATPILIDDKVFLSAAYGVGCVMARIDKQQPDILWSNDSTLSSQYNTPVYHDGHLYGINGREDVGQAELRCVEAATGKVRWTEPGLGVAHLVIAGDLMLVLTIDGSLVLAKADPERFQPLARTRISSATTRALPALANGRLYVRDNGRSDGSLFCLQVGE